MALRFIIPCLAVAAVVITPVFAFSGGGGESGEGQTCDAINLCDVNWEGSGISCPPGMTKVAPPERSPVYEFSSSVSSYVPNELVEVELRVTARLIQKKLNAGVLQCECADCGLGYTACGGTNTVPHMENAKYIGLLMYAVRVGDANEVKVGSWEIAEEVPPRFVTPPDPGCDGRALMHASANGKNYYHRFSFRAPPAGTGAIVFRVLIKQGDTNGGAFYWPGPLSSAPPSAGVACGDLVLTEGVAAAAQTWFRGASMETCVDTCASRGLACDEATMAAALESNALPSEINRHFLCQRPTLASCEPDDVGMLATTSLPDRLCWSGRPASTCPAGAPPSVPATPLCDLSPTRADVRRFCACSSPPGMRRALAAEALERGASDGSKHHETTGAAASASSPCPYTRRVAAQENIFSGDDASTRSSGARQSGLAAATPTATVARRYSTPSACDPLAILGGVATTALALTSAASPGGRSGGIRLVLWTLVATELTHAHNWINSPRSRATRASTVSPCRQRVDPTTPSVKVNAGQHFHIEWSTGHHRSTHYFVLLAAADEHRLATLTSTMLDEYLAGAPASPVAMVYNGSYWSKRHFGWSDSQANGGADSLGDFLAEGKQPVTDMTDPYYLERPAAFCWSHLGQRRNSPSSSGDCVAANDLTLYRYASSDLAGDRRVAYASSAHPWILSVHRFRNGASWAQQFDVAPFELPAGTPPGQYIAHYYWRGYRDCIDIDVLPDSLPVAETSNARYGYKDTELTTYQRIDHCQYEAGTYQVYSGSKESCYSRSGSTCFIIPPPGQTNSNGETAEEALAECQRRCNRNKNRCTSVVVVPHMMPAAVALDGGGETNAPWGTANCKHSCFEGEPANSSVCYGLRGFDNKNVEEEWTVVDRDAEDEIFYSTCYRRIPGYAFDSPGCGDACYAAGGPAQPVAWRFAEQCVACEVATRNAVPTSVPFWELADECVLCNRDDVGPALPAPPPIPSRPVIVSAPSPPVDDASTFGGITGCGDGTYCCVAIYRGAAGEQCEAVPVWDLSSWNHPGGSFVQASSLCGSVRTGWLARSSSHASHNPEAGSSLLGGGVRVGSFVHPACSAAVPPSPQPVHLDEPPPPPSSPSPPPQPPSPPLPPSEPTSLGFIDDLLSRSYIFFGVRVPAVALYGGAAATALLCVCAAVAGCCCCRRCCRGRPKSSSNPRAPAKQPSFLQRQLSKRGSSRYVDLDGAHQPTSSTKPRPRPPPPTPPSAGSAVEIELRSARADRPVAAAPPPPPPPALANNTMLPPGWMAVGTAEGETYFWNEHTGETSWEPPHAVRYH